MAMKECQECGREISTKAESCPHCGAPQKSNKSSIPMSLRIIGVVIVLFLVIKFPSLIMNDKASDYSSLPEKTTSLTPSYADSLPKPSVGNDAIAKKVALSSVTITNYRPLKGASGMILTADFTIKNDSPYNIKDITITCTHYAKSGTKIDSNTRTIYDSIRAGKSKTFRKFNMGFIHSQAHSSSPEITDLKVE